MFTILWLMLALVLMFLGEIAYDIHRVWSKAKLEKRYGPKLARFLDETRNL